MIHWATQPKIYGNNVLLLWVYMVMIHWATQPNTYGNNVQLLRVYMLMIHSAAEAMSFDGFDKLRHGSINTSKKKTYHTTLAFTVLRGHCFDMRTFLCASHVIRSVFLLKYTWSFACKFCSLKSDTKLFFFSGSVWVFQKESRSK